MFVKSIKLTNYKNYQTGQFQFDDKVNAIVGLNGMGKTNLVDAIYYVCMGKSYFSTSDKLVNHHESNFFRLDAIIDDVNVVVKVQQPKLKEIAVNGIAFERMTEYVGTHPIVVMAPDDIHNLLLLGENRRIFINNTIVQYDQQYLNELLLYNRLLKQRNALLKSFLEERRQNLVLLETITQQMEKPASYLAAQRQRFILSLKPIFQTHFEIICGGKESADLLYDSDLETVSFAELSKKNLDKDLITGRTNGGIHKDDIKMMLDGEKIKDFASQGQIKSFILAIKLAQYDLLKLYSGKSPLLLLDDIFDKLDPTRVDHLLSIVTSAEFGQVFITDTDEDKVPALLDGRLVNYKKIHIL
ncbi:MAG: DNA replication and repair protein RecF [Saprospiraceae bacterium]|nr:DNA replication and repair protein RecF [Saprospiraceae bacterium]